MANDERSRLRNLVLPVRLDPGKTSLAEHVLHATGAIARAGRVDDGTASLDWEPEEQKRKLSLSLAVATFNHAEHRITFIDTPAMPNFVGELISAFSAVDGALITTDAGSPIGAGTENAIAEGRALGRAPSSWSPGATVRTWNDGGRGRPAQEFGSKIAPLQVAIGKADSFRGHVDVVHGRALGPRGRQAPRGPGPGRPRERGGGPTERAAGSRGGSG